MIVVVKVLVWVAPIVNMVGVVGVLSIEVLPDVEVIMVGVILNVLKVALPVSYSVDVSSDVAVDLFMDAVMLAVLPGIDTEALADMSDNAVAVVITALEFPL